MEAYDYELPEAAIAQVPAEPRDAARLLVSVGGTIAHRTIADLPELLEDGDVVVVNDTRVLPARLRMRRDSGGAAEVLLLEQRDDGCWEALTRPARKIAVGEVLRSAHPAGDHLAVEVLEPLDDTGRRRVRLLVDGDPAPALERHGHLPLPPYIRQPLADPDRYQTVYANRPGSVAAPTAGLHLTPSVLERCRARGIAVVAIELAVGLDTFRPVTSARPEQHRIHSERYSVPAETIRACQTARRVVAVGTTTVRALESAASGAASGRTHLFIHGSYQWKVVDVLLTNFHLPRSSLLLMVESFAGPRWRELYALALAEGYRFLSFGDAMLLDRAR